MSARSCDAATSQSSSALSPRNDARLALIEGPCVATKDVAPVADDADADADNFDAVVAIGDDDVCDVIASAIVESGVLGGMCDVAGKEEVDGGNEGKGEDEDDTGIRFVCIMQ